MKKVKVKLRVKNELIDYYYESYGEYEFYKSYLKTILTSLLFSIKKYNLKNIDRNRQ